ncbi:MAG TPA: cytochrome c peroxidase, partial [Bryobacteraceae bacterium]
SSLGLIALSVSIPGPLLRAQNPRPVFSPELIRFVTPTDNPSSDAKIALGRKLFEDKRLSADNTVSCATCHDSSVGFTARLETAKGIRDQVGKRNAPTVLNAMFFHTEFWDGRAPSLEEQAKLPILNPIEMGQKNPRDVVSKLSAIPEYTAEFQHIFGRALNYDDLGRAIAAFERTLVSGEAPIDRFLRGDDSALNSAQRRGWTLFNGKARCNGCHAFNPTMPIFSDNRFHNIGIAAHNHNFEQLAARAVHAGTSATDIDRLAIETDASELGRFLVTRVRSDIGAFKTPGLREIVLTAPYMHDGTLPTLWDVMDHYNKGGEVNPFLDGGMQRLGLNEDEIDDLVALMSAFTSDQYAAQAETEMRRQQTFRQGPRKTRDTEAAMGRKGNLGDALPTPDKKDPALIGGRPVSN